MRGRNPYTAEELAVLREYGATHSAREIAAMLPGRNESNVANKLSRMGIHKDPEKLLRLRRKVMTDIINAYRSDPERRAAWIAQCTKSIRAYIARDKARIRMGLDPLSKRIYPALSRRLRFSLYYVRCQLRRYGYIILPGGMVCYYDDNTQRFHGRKGRYDESYYEQKYHFRFRPVSQIGEEEEHVRATHQDAPPIIFD